MAKVTAKMKPRKYPQFERVAFSGSVFGGRAKAPRRSLRRLLSPVRLFKRVFGRASADAAAPAPAAPDAASWRAVCDKGGVVSYFDYGLRL